MGYSHYVGLRRGNISIKIIAARASPSRRTGTCKSGDFALGFQPEF